ncbi:hypothetical protein ES705_49371 [subsurface metagenome]
MPGIADMHCHVSEFFEPVNPLHLFLANGVTTIRNLNGGKGNFILRWREGINNGTIIGPKIYTAGPTFFFSTDDYENIILEQKKYGYDFIKVYS